MTKINGFFLVPLAVTQSLNKNVGKKYETQLGLPRKKQPKKLLALNGE